MRPPTPLGVPRGSHFLPRGVMSAIGSTSPSSVTFDISTVDTRSLGIQRLKLNLRPQRLAVPLPVASFRAREIPLSEPSSSYPLSEVLWSGLSLSQRS